MSAEPTLDEIEAAARALDTARQAYGAAMMRAFVHVENKRYEATRKVADMSHTIMLRDETIATLTRERDEALAIVDVLRGVGCNEDGDGPCGVCRKCAYRHGAEYMREACARWFREHDESFELTVDACHDVIADMSIPEEP